MNDPRRVLSKGQTGCAFPRPRSRQIGPVALSYLNASTTQTNMEPRKARNQTRRGGVAMGASVGIGIAIGAAVGTAMQNEAMGVALGTAFGVAVGALLAFTTGKSN